MNRSVLAVSLVGFLLIQGSVAGFLADDSGVSNVTGNDTTNQSVAAISTGHFENTSVATLRSTSDGAPSDEPDSTTSNNSGLQIPSENGSTGEPTTSDAPASSATTNRTTTNTSPGLSTLSSIVSQATGEQAGENRSTRSATIPTGGAAQANGSPSPATAGSQTRAANATNGASGAAAPQTAAPSGVSGAGAQRGATAVPDGASAASPDAEFDVVSVSSDAPVGGTGNVSVTIENTGEDATNAVVSLQSMTGDLLFGQSPNTSRFVGDWDEGENETIEVRARVTPTAQTQQYPVRATVSYEDSDGNASQSAPHTFGVTPERQQEFSLSGVNGDLRGGDSGTISGTITNNGPKTATDAVLTFAPNGTRDVIPRQSQYVLGNLTTDESESFSLPVVVNSTTEPGKRQVPFVVQYYDSDGNPMVSQTLTAQVTIASERNDFAIQTVETDVASGEQGTLSVTMNNTGENITDATVSFQSLSGSVVFGRSANATRYVEDWDTGDRRTFEFDVAATEDTGDETYPMQASVRYNDSDGDPGQSGPFSFGVTPDEGGDDFAVVSTTSNVQVGGEGPISVTMENTGENASEAVVNLQSLTSDITFGRVANATAFVGDWPAGAQRTVTVNATASNGTETRSYPFRASVSYNDSAGDESQAGPFTTGVTPQPEQTFAIANSSSTLRVGDEGNITARVTNQGPQDIRNAVVELVTQGQNIETQATEAAVGSLAAGESATVSFPIEVSDNAESGQRQFSFVVEYDNQNGDTRRSGRLDTQAAVAPERDAFIVTRANASVGAGSSGTVTLNVTNNHNAPVNNIDAKAFVDDPLSASSGEAYLAHLEPHETKQISFDISASGSASAGQYPLSVDFQYDDASGDTQLSQTYKVPVRVTASGGGGLFSSVGLLVGLGVLVVVFGVGLVWSRR